MKRIALAALVAVLLAAWCLPAFAEDGQARQWSVSFEAAAPGETDTDRALLALLSALEAEGTFASSHGAFTLDGSFRLDKAGRSATGFRLYGREDRWIAESSLLGDVRLMFNNPAMLEFACKIREHLDLPVEQLPLLYPYVWKDALAAPSRAWAEYVRVPEGGGKVAGADLIDFAKRLAELADTDRSFRYLVSVLFEDSEDDHPLAGLPRTTATWLDKFAPNGIDVIADEHGEVWEASGWVLLTRRPDGGIASFDLPDMLGGSLISFRDTTGEDGTREISLTVSRRLDARVTLSETAGITLDISGTMAQRLPAPALHDTADGTVLHLSTVESEGGSLHLRLVPENGVWILRAADGRDMLRIRFTADACTPASWPAWQIGELDGVNLYSLNDSSLPDLVNRIREPALHGVIRLVAAAPTETVVLVMDWLEEHLLDSFE